MARDEKLTAPYAPIKNVLDVVHKLRDRGIPNPLTPESVQSIGVPDGNAHRAVFAMKFLGLVDEDGAPTASADRVRHASTAEYPEVFAEIVRAAYAKVFELVDPAADSDIEISDAFRRFDPAGQRFRMVPLFMGLCAEAGIIPAERAGQVKVARPKASSGTPRKAKQRDSGQDTPLRNTEIRREMPPSLDGGRREPPPAGQLFAISEEDIGTLGEEEFTDVWNALGVLARARARARKESLDRLREEEEARQRASQAMWSGFLAPQGTAKESDAEGE